MADTEMLGDYQPTKLKLPRSSHSFTPLHNMGAGVHAIMGLLPVPKELCFD